MRLSGRQTFIRNSTVWLLRTLFWLLYNPFAWTYDWVAAIVSLGSWKEWVQTVIPFLYNEPILEIGYGPGHLQKALLQNGSDAFGLDLSSAMGRIAWKRLQQANIQSTLVRGTAFNLPFPRSHFGSIVATFPSEFIASRRSLSEIMRVLKPNGQLVILPVAWITGKSWLERLAAWIFRLTGQSPGLPVHGEVPFDVHVDWIQGVANSAKQLGITVSFHIVRLRTSCVLIILAENDRFQAN